MNSENSKTSDPRRLLLNPSDKRNLNKSDKYVALSNLSIYHKLKINKKIQKLTISTQTSIDKFELHYRPDSVSDIQEYFEYILKKYMEKRLIILY